MGFKSVKEVFQKMPSVFDPNQAKNLEKVFLFEITGEQQGQYYVVIKNGTCQVEEGVHSSPDVTLTMSDETWLGMVNKEISGVKAFMTGKLKVKGDLMLAQRIYDLFPL
ncbi:MAG: SCP2 sterol-binding domain-containing protein [Desulfatiglandales bacterium]